MSGAFRSRHPENRDRKTHQNQGGNTQGTMWTVLICFQEQWKSDSPREDTGVNGIRTQVVHQAIRRCQSRPQFVQEVAKSGCSNNISRDASSK
jgi:hypothetical protein